MTQSTWQQFYTRCLIAIPLVVVLLLIVATSMLVRPLAAWAQTLDVKTSGSLQADAADTATITEFYRLVAGVDAATGLVQALSVNSSGEAKADTELPAAAALADATANPTVPGVGAYLMGWNGTTYDKLDIDSADNLMVSLGTVLDGANDSISIKVANVVPTMVNTTYLAISPYVWGTTAADTALKATHVTGAATLGTTPAATSCTTVVAATSQMTTGSEYFLRVVGSTASVIYINHGDFSTVTDPTATTAFPMSDTDLPLRIKATATTDGIECITAAGTASLFITPVTYN